MLPDDVWLTSLTREVADLSGHRSASSSGGGTRRSSRFRDARIRTTASHVLLSRLQVFPDLTNVQLHELDAIQGRRADVVDFTIAADITVAGSPGSELKSASRLPPRRADRDHRRRRARPRFRRWFLPRPTRRERRSRSRTPVAMSSRRSTRTSQQVAAARSAPKIEVADVYRLAKAMPIEIDMPDLLLELSQLARDTGIRFDAVSPQPAAAVGSYSVLPISSRSTATSTTSPIPVPAADARDRPWWSPRCDRSAIRSRHADLQRSAKGSSLKSRPRS